MVEIKLGHFELMEMKLFVRALLGFLLGKTGEGLVFPSLIEDEKTLLQSWWKNPWPAGGRLLSHRGASENRSRLAAALVFV